MMVATEAAAGLKLYCRGGEGCCGREAERLCGAGEGDCDHDDQVTHGYRAGNDPSRSCTLLYFVLGYGFHVENPDEVIKGAKPRLREVGPFIYKAVTIKDSVDFDTGKVNLHYNEDGETLTYRQR